MHYTKHVIKLFSYHLLFSAFSAVLFFALSNFAVTNVGGLVYSGSTALFYLIAVYSVVWHIGAKDMRSGAKIRPSKGLIVALLAESVTYIYLALCLFFMNDIMLIAYRIWQFTYIGFMSFNNTGQAVNISYFLINIPVLAAASFGYIAGVRGFDLTERIIAPIIIKDKR